MLEQFTTLTMFTSCQSANLTLRLRLWQIVSLTDSSLSKSSRVIQFHVLICPTKTSFSMTAVCIPGIVSSSENFSPESTDRSLRTVTFPP